ncbi:hypothetical protein [Actinoplanes palleronii]|uniref:Uncharacterized protein n=1 Tax=Actinoplanes palleronii TaxID=113570 RepID=A0ABQ4BJJ3_9ACTN|nr:hypothetical protein [Actinoplanes palleronii]GIE70782.1 hypothetical protein Apa02nite_068900 [Actinoplanes palleronii]
MARHTPVLEAPAPLTPPISRCRFPELIAQIIPLRFRQHAVLHPCFERATRQVTVGLHVGEPLCLWHSLVACHRLGGHLVREPVT